MVQAFVSILKQTFILLTLGLSPAFSNSEWFNVEFSPKNNHSMTSKAIGIMGIATYKNQKTNAYIILEARKNEGIYTFDVVLDKLDSVFAEPSIDKFRGPELSEQAIKNNAISISIKTSRQTYVFSTRMVLSGTTRLPGHIKNNNSECLSANLRQTKKEVLAWNDFLNKMQSGFEQGHITISNKILPSPLNITFSGQGVENLLFELLNYANVALNK